MGKRKSSDYDKIIKKVKKLERKLKGRRRISSSSDSAVDDNVFVEDELERSPFLASDPEISEEIPNMDEKEETTELDQEILAALGEDPNNEKQFGENIHKDLALRWKYILINGILKEDKMKMIKDYSLPENCDSLQPPKINLEIKAAISEITFKKDLFCQSKQTQLACSLTAIGKVLTTVLSQAKKDSDMQNIIKPLSDAGKLICDYHYRVSQERRYSIMNTLNKETKDVVKITKRDEFLFGSELAEHIKSSKAIKKSVVELKARYTPSTQRINSGRGALNSRGASQAAATDLRRHPPILRRQFQRKQPQEPNKPRRDTTYSRQQPRRQ